MGNDFWRKWIVKIIWVPAYLNFFCFTLLNCSPKVKWKEDLFFFRHKLSLSLSLLCFTIQTTLSLSLSLSLFVSFPVSPEIPPLSLCFLSETPMDRNLISSSTLIFSHVGKFVFHLSLIQWFRAAFDSKRCTIYGRVFLIKLFWMNRSLSTMEVEVLIPMQKFWSDFFVIFFNFFYKYRSVSDEVGESNEMAGDTRIAWHVLYTFTLFPSSTYCLLFYYIMVCCSKFYLLLFNSSGWIYFPDYKMKKKLGLNWSSENS